MFQLLLGFAWGETAPPAAITQASAMWTAENEVADWTSLPNKADWTSEAQKADWTLIPSRTSP